MDDLGFPQQDPMVLWEDNMACNYMLQTSVMYHKELCKDGALVLEKVASADQVADSLTKSTLKPAFEKHCDAMMGLKGSRN
eukprot:3495700-Rhodomonas_salina.1